MRDHTSTARSIGKFENPERLAELDPQGTLQKIGLSNPDIVCDIGAGTGIFALAAAKMTNNTVFALDINETFLEIINEKASKENIINIRTQKVTADLYDIDSNQIDLVLMVTVFHELQNKGQVLREIKRIAKAGGSLCIIEFHKRATPMGPPVNDRLGKNEVTATCLENGFQPIQKFDLGANFYCIVFRSGL